MTVVQEKTRRQLRDEKISMILALALFGLVVARLGDMSPLAARVRPALLTLVVTVIYFSTAYRRIGLQKIIQDKVFVLSVLYFGWIVFTVPFAIWRGRAFDAVFLGPIALVLLLALSAVPAEKKVLEKFLKWIVGLTALSGLVTLRAGVSRVGRLSTGGMLDPNDLASLLAAMLPFALAIGMGMAKGRLLHKLLAWGAVGLMALVLLQTGSRGGMVALMAGLMVVAFRLNAQRMVTFGLIAAVVVPLLWTQTPPEIRDRFASLGSLGGDYNMTEDWGRVATWKRGIGYIVANPVTGLGYGNFATAEGFRLRDLGAQGPYYSAHNAYIQAFAELGFVGGILLLMILGEGARRGFRLWRAGRPEYLASLAAFSTGAIFLSHAYSYILYGIMGIIVVASRTLDPVGSGAQKKLSARQRMMAQRSMPVPASGQPVPEPGVQTPQQGTPGPVPVPVPGIQTPPQSGPGPVPGVETPPEGRRVSPLLYRKS